MSTQQKSIFTETRMFSFTVKNHITVGLVSTNKYTLVKLQYLFDRYSHSYVKKKGFILEENLKTDSRFFCFFVLSFGDFELVSDWIF